MDRFERAARIWAAAESIARSAAIIESKFDLDPNLLDGVDAALKAYLGELGDDEAFEKVLGEIAQFLQALPAAELSNR
jgi:hypothetical protein